MKNLLGKGVSKEEGFCYCIECDASKQKMPMETMITYKDKVVMSEQCDTEGEKAMSCIVGGLPIDLQANARGFQGENTWRIVFRITDFREALPSTSRLFQS